MSTLLNDSSSGWFSHHPTTPARKHSATTSTTTCQTAGPWRGAGVAIGRVEVAALVGQHPPDHRACVLVVGRRLCQPRHSMRIGVFFPTKEHAPLDETVARMVEVATRGFSSVWLPQSFGFDALTLLALVGRDEAADGGGARHVRGAHVPAPSRGARRAGAHRERGHRITARARHRALASRDHRADVRVVVRPSRRGTCASTSTHWCRCCRTAQSTSTARPSSRARAARACPARPRPRCCSPHCSRGCSRSRAAWPTARSRGARARSRSSGRLFRCSTTAATEAGRPEPRVVVALPTIVTDDEAHGRRRGRGTARGIRRPARVPRRARRRRRRRSRRRLRRRRRGRRHRAPRATALGRSHRLRRHPHRHRAPIAGGPSTTSPRWSTDDGLDWPRLLRDPHWYVDRVAEDPDRQQLLTALTTEHFTLQSARSQTASESVSRASLYILAVSSTLVVLGFIGPASQTGSTFDVFALTVLPTLYVLGVFTFVRVVECGAEDFRYGVAINRIRNYYKQIAGDQAKLFLLSGHDDGRGVFENAAVPSEKRKQFFTFATVVAVVNSVVGGSAIRSPSVRSSMPRSASPRVWADSLRSLPSSPCSSLVRRPVARGAHQPHRVDLSFAGLTQAAHCVGMYVAAHRLRSRYVRRISLVRAFHNWVWACSARRSARRRSKAVSFRSLR